MRLPIHILRGLAFFGATVAACAQTSGLPSHITEHDIVESMLAEGIVVAPRQVKMLSTIPVRKEHPSLEAIKIEPLSADASRVLLRCVDRSACIPFYAVVNGLSQDQRIPGNTLKAKVSSSHRAAIGTPVMKRGSMATLEIVAPEMLITGFGGLCRMAGREIKLRFHWLTAAERTWLRLSGRDYSEASYNGLTMDRMYKTRIAAFLFVALMVLPASAKLKTKKDNGAQLRAAYIHKVQQASTAQPVERTLGSLWSSGAPLTEVAADFKATRLNDVVIIQVVEQTSAQTNGNTQQNRTYAATSAITALGGHVSVGGVNPIVNAASSEQLKGNGQVGKPIPTANEPYRASRLYSAQRKPSG